MANGAAAVKNPVGFEFGVGESDVIGQRAADVVEFLTELAEGKHLDGVVVYRSCAQILVLVFGVVTAGRQVHVDAGNIDRQVQFGVEGQCAAAVRRRVVLIQCLAIAIDGVADHIEHHFLGRCAHAAVGLERKLAAQCPMNLLGLAQFIAPFGVFRCDGAFEMVPKSR